MTKIKKTKKWKRFLGSWFEGTHCMVTGKAWQKKREEVAHVSFNSLSPFFLFLLNPAHEIVPPALRVSAVSLYFELSGNTFIFTIRAMSPR